MEKILEINPSILLIQIVAFVLLALVFWKFLFGSVISLLDSRRKEISDQYEDAENKSVEAEKLKDDYLLKLTNVEEEIRNKLAEAVKDGQKMREEIITESRTQSDNILTKAREEIEREKNAAIVELKNTVVSLTLAAAGKIIEEKLDDKKHHEMISKFIDEFDGIKR
jgi:F-type H+-transporting ATPase subunit b